MVANWKQGPFVMFMLIYEWKQFYVWRNKIIRNVFIGSMCTNITHWTSNQGLTCLFFFFLVMTPHSSTWGKQWELQNLIYLFIIHFFHIPNIYFFLKHFHTTASCFGSQLLYPDKPVKVKYKKWIANINSYSVWTVVLSSLICHYGHFFFNDVFWLLLHGLLVSNSVPSGQTCS